MARWLGKPKIGASLVEEGGNHFLRLVSSTPGEMVMLTWVPAMLGFIQSNKLHWTAFAFHPKAAPAMLTGWDYTPNATWGAFVKRALAGEKFELDKMRTHVRRPERRPRRPA